MATTGPTATAARQHWRMATDTNSEYFNAGTMYVVAGEADLVVRVESATAGSVAGFIDGKKEKPTRKVMLKFEGHDKPLGLNVTNAKTIEAMYGTPYYADWNDQHVVLVLYVQAETNNGKPGVRIRSTKPPQDVIALFEMLDNAPSLAAIDEMTKGKLKEAPPKFKPALKITMDRRIAKLAEGDGEGPGRD